MADCPLDKLPPLADYDSTGYMVQRSFQVRSSEAFARARCANVFIIARLWTLSSEENPKACCSVYSMSSVSRYPRTRH